MNFISLLVAILTYSLIMTRGITKIPPWASMFFGGVLMIALGVITPEEGLQAINLDVILFLITIFIFASALEISGFLKFLASWIINKFRSLDRILFATLFLSGILSNLVTNDGLSASWTPVILDMKETAKTDGKPFLYALAFGVTIGSVMMPTGNPQNLLIALDSNIREPFIVFLKYLAIPTIINLLVTYPILKLMFRNQITKTIIQPVKIEISNKRLAYISLGLLLITVVLFFVLSFLRIDILLGSLITSSFLLLISKERRDIVRRIDWATILFFIGLFIFIQGLVAGGIVSFIYSKLPPISSVLLIFISSIILSQLLSNVPLVAIFIPIMFHFHQTSIIDWLALAAGSTIAGNFTLIGAASNIIISEAAESRGEKGFNFFEFIKYSVPVLLVNFAILYLFLTKTP
ncbi:anion transporter [Acidianus sulfidivorans JP7]|uniref:Anion transporter n=1 Tax=Acidianus sulfidivorans JP7 TaxID=619593 RepID=A0A2U9IM60_9CREN|nr:SLC13 family permease [Acidianus sulfidivorans]AWR97004.1 anion transporter [Acidianus sulfidivorans JP7]